MPLALKVSSPTTSPLLFIVAWSWTTISTTYLSLGFQVHLSLGCARNANLSPLVQSDLHSGQVGSPVPGLGAPPLLISLPLQPSVTPGGDFHFSTAAL